VGSDRESCFFRVRIDTGWGECRIWRRGTEECVGKIIARIFISTFGTVLRTRSFGGHLFRSDDDGHRRSSKKTIHLLRAGFSVFPNYCLFFEIDITDGCNDRNTTLIPLLFSKSSLPSSYPDFIHFVILCPPIARICGSYRLYNVGVLELVSRGGWCVRGSVWAADWKRWSLPTW